MKEIKLTFAQKLALMAAVNNEGKFPPQINWNVREFLKFHGLARVVFARTSAEMDKEVRDAWNKVRESLKSHDRKSLHEAESVLAGERWRREEKVLVITQAGRDLITSRKLTISIPADEPKAAAGGKL